VPKVLFAMSPIGGGAEVFVEIAAGLAARGWTADMLVPSHTRAHAIDAGTRLRYFEVPPCESRAPELGSVAHHFAYAHGAYRALAACEREYDLVVAHLPWGVAKMYARRRSRPLVGFCDCCWTDTFLTFGEKRPTPAADWVGYDLQVHLHDDTMRACDRLLAPSRFFAARMGRRGFAVDVIPHGRDPARYPPAADKALAKRKAGMPAERKMVLAVGFDFGRKGHHLTAEVALRLSESEAYVVIAGPRHEQFAHWFGRDETLHRRLFVHPHAPHDAVARYLAAADVFLFPSYMESFGLAPVEAMASEVPVVAHRSASLPELIDDGVEGFLCPEGDVDAIAARVMELLHDDARRREMGRAGRARVRRDFTLERTVGAWDAYLREAAKGPVRSEDASGAGPAGGPGGAPPAAALGGAAP
jgi:glycosyltransferase involved in cell wall biosynthesis